MSMYGKRLPTQDVHVTEQAHMEVGALAVSKTPLRLLDAVEYKMGVT